MLFQTKQITLKNGKQVIFRSPRREDAAMMIEQLQQMTMESDYLLRSPEEVTMTVEKEENFIQSINQSENNWMILCEVDGQYVGNCHLQRYSAIKTRHRGAVAIGLSRCAWGMGIGTAMFEEMIRIARENGMEQLELGVVGGNERGLALYGKMGFRTYGELPNAFLMKDGSKSPEVLMLLEL